MPHVREIKRFTKSANYSVHVSWAGIEQWVAWSERDFGLDLNPDFQRGHVWTPEQKVNYVEFIMKGGQGADEIKFNCTDWMKGNMDQPLVIVDGLQRLTAVREFMKGEFEAFAHTVNKWEGINDLIRYRFTVLINDLETRYDVLNWYLELNGGGTPHTEKELRRVKKLMVAENASHNRNT